tara:strand:- start:1829 stop:2236 length:408 start_codon:yes stop_codon:yes gene_type:complete
MIGKKMMGAGLAAGLGALYMRNRNEKSKVQFDDPWGDNIQVPYMDGQPIRGEAANAYNPFSVDPGMQDILYRGHTGQKINKKNYKPEDIQKAIQWYQRAFLSVQAKMKQYPDNVNIMNSQREKIEEIQTVMKQLV